MNPPSTAGSAVADAVSPWRESTVGSVLIDAARRWPERVAVQWPEGDDLRSLTYTEVLVRAHAGAALLRATATAPVAIFAPNGPGWYIALWAVALSGRSLVPINPALTAAELAVVLQDSGAGTVLAAGDYRGSDLRAIASSLEIDGLAVLDIDGWIDTRAESGPEAPPQPSDPFVIQYTSGTTGKPKGAVLSHRVCVNAAATMLPVWRCSEDDICCSALPLHHVGGLIAHALALAVAGARYVMLAAPAPEFAETARRTGATLLAGVPTTYIRMLDDPSVADTDLPEVRVLMIGGASIPAALIDRLEARFGAVTSVMYGQSEAPAITATGLDDPSWVKAQTVGRVLPLREVQITDPDTGRALPVGEVGEIWVRTPIRMDCYLGDASASAEVLTGDDWLRTGDLGCLDDSGLVYFRGRLREMIVRGGANIYPREIESVIESCPDVAQVAVVGLPDPCWGEIVAAVVVARDGVALEPAVLSAWSASRLARYKQPQMWHIVAEMPCTASGKPQKRRITELLLTVVEKYPR